MAEHSKEMAAHISSLAAELRGTVAAIESGIKITQNHYGQYMSILAMGKDARSHNILAHALVEAGANRQGVADAMRAIS